MSWDAGDAIDLLVLEDEAADVELLRAHLQRVPDAAFRVQSVHTLSAAREAVAGTRFDVALVDLRLPDAAGAEVVHALRDLPSAPPLIVLTGAEQKNLALRCIEAGAQDYLAKDDLTPTSLWRSVGFALFRHREQRYRELERTVSRYRDLSSAGTATSVTRQLAVSLPLRDNVDADFDALAERYRGIFDTYVDQVVVRGGKPLAAMSELTQELGAHGAGPRDLVDLHLGVLERLLGSATPARAQALTIDGRLLALEMMGQLVDYYRLGHRGRQGAAVFNPESPSS
ncbi:MAG: response regulator [Myxococcota bacterium]